MNTALLCLPIVSSFSLQLKSNWVFISWLKCNRYLTFMNFKEVVIIKIEIGEVVLLFNKCSQVCTFQILGRIVFPDDDGWLRPCDEF